MASKLTARSIFGILLVAVAAGLLALVVHNYSAPTPREMFEGRAGGVDLALKEINYTETREGKRRWTLVADSAAHSIGAGTTRIENVRMTFFAIDGIGELTLTARSGELRSEAREVTVQGDVVVRSPKGYALYTDHLQYREADRLARTDAPVRLVSSSMEVTGTGMHLDVRNYSVVLLKDVKARLAAPGGNAG